jgi:hypothetical protein
MVKRIATICTDEQDAASRQPITVTLTQDTVVALSMLDVSHVTRADGEVVAVAPFIDRTLLIGNLLVAIKDNKDGDALLKALDSSIPEMVTHTANFLRVNRLNQEADKGSQH